MREDAELYRNEPPEMFKPPLCRKTETDSATCGATWLNFSTVQMISVANLLSGWEGTRRTISHSQQGASDREHIGMRGLEWGNRSTQGGSK